MADAKAGGMKKGALSVEGGKKVAQVKKAPTVEPVKPTGLGYSFSGTTGTKAAAEACASRAASKAK